jgi:Nuclease-related domain
MTSTEDMAARTDFAGIQALSSRGPGYAVAAKCLQVQADAEARDPSLKTVNGVRLHPDAWSWYTGTLGEIEVGRMLTALGPEWFARHSVPIGADTKDVDHLVIGPGGVFAINTKHHRGASIWVGDHVLRVNNSNTPHLNIAQGDGLDVARRLQSKVGFPVAVTPVISVLNARSVVDRRAPDNRRVKVVEANQLVAWLRAQPRSLDEARLGLIKLAAEEPETWHLDPHAADTLRVMQRFERLAAQVGTPTAPTASPRTVRPARQRRPTGRPAPRKPARPRARKKSTVSDLFRLWFAIGLIVAAIFMFRGYADQPCATALTCLVPSFYLALKPLLIFGGVVALLTGMIGTLTWMVRTIRR